MKRILSACIIVLFSISCMLASSYCNTVSTAQPSDNAQASDETDLEFSAENWKKNHTKVRGIYVTGPTAGSDRMADIISLINDTELNAIVLDVKDEAGNITFMMDNEKVVESGACIPYIKDINALLEELHDNNIYVIARIPCFKDPVLAEASPELCLRTLSGDAVTDANGNAWVNPCKEEVWEYITSIAGTCAKLGFDEIQLDYVRFPVGQNSADAYYGVPTSDENKQEYINQFLSMVTELVHSYNTPLTADVFGTIIRSNVDSKHIGQNYAFLASKLDVICPMIYPSHYANGEFDLDVPDARPYETILAALTASKDVLSDLSEDQCAVVRPWLQAFTANWVEGHIEYNGWAIRQQINAVYDAGYEEWILWNSKSEYSSYGLESE